MTAPAARLGPGPAALGRGGAGRCGAGVCRAGAGDFAGEASTTGGAPPGVRWRGRAAGAALRRLGLSGLADFFEGADDRKGGGCFVNAGVGCTASAMPAWLLTWGAGRLSAAGLAACSAQPEMDSTT